MGPGGVDALERASRTQPGVLPPASQDSARPVLRGHQAGGRQHGMRPLTQRLPWSLRRQRSTLPSSMGTLANSNTLVWGFCLSQGSVAAGWGFSTAQKPIRPPAAPAFLSVPEHRLPPHCSPSLSEHSPPGVQTLVLSTLSQRHIGVHRTHFLPRLPSHHVCRSRL